MFSLTHGKLFSHCARRRAGGRFAATAMFAGLLAIATLVGPGAGAACAKEPAQPADVLSVAAGSGTLIELPQPAVAVFVADPSVADVHVPTPRSVFVLGKKSGTTTLFAIGPNNREILRKTISVSTDTASIQRLLDARFPKLAVTVSGAPGSLMVSGAVPSAADADAIVQTLQPYLHANEQIVNRLSIAHPIQVLLRVRITEVDRNITQQLGINWNAIGAGGNFFGGLFNGRAIFDATTNLFNIQSTGAFSVLGGFKAGKTTIEGVLDALDEEGLLTLLAEPNLTAMSGQTASFLAGGELPIPVPQSGTTSTITIEYKPYGVALNFTPTVLADNRISLNVRPEVSQIDSANSITLNSIVVPALSVRRMETTVELSSGQSFAIGGLLQSSTSDVLSELPGLGELPILGKLFSSKKYQNNKSELVVIVTPYIVGPTGPGQLRGALDDVITPSSDIEFAVRQSLSIDPLAGNSPRLVGAAGFVY
ncbi:type II and III secretion system protein family protein [Paraburkholderia silviterrae]|uniref:Type II and III secretion system protein family protein n=2 Tax=Paraburkholderia silviterrae TaxID=2528715 RepID=A0A4R5M1F0_9BURK|nr:type II and III secretion system protein family protein [Paraburkholderia silviterrae]TDG19123.1 type II and III secretion system protein family protein [Paraburkholderia silviterrae]